ncbi:MAG: DUF1836 domain-containing protein [Blautia sp.]|nr:DUF1836 domain-containing protein [Blautia sp.]
MNDNSKEYVKSILDSLSKLDHIKPEDFPNIDLYMDQVTTFMDTQLASSKRYPEDKILTKTMINNYAKNKLLPPPDKKRYSKEHLLMLIFIYYFKNILSISDIQTLMTPITEKYFQSESDHDLTYIYEEVFHMEKSSIFALQKDVLKSYQTSEDTFPDADPEEREFLHRFSFICRLAFDVYARKMIIESLIDDLAKDQTKKDPPADKKNKKK